MLGFYRRANVIGLTPLKRGLSVKGTLSSKAVNQRHISSVARTTKGTPVLIICDISVGISPVGQGLPGFCIMNRILKQETGDLVVQSTG